MSEVTDTTKSKVGGDEITTTVSTESILLAGILTESEYVRTVNTNTHNNDEAVQVSYVIVSYSGSDEASNFDMEDSFLWWTMKRLPIFMKNKTRLTS